MMLGGIVTSLQELGVVFKNADIDDVVTEYPSVMAMEHRFISFLTRLNFKRLKKEGKPFLDVLRKLITDNYQMHRISDMEIYTNAFFKAILDQIGIKIPKKMMESYWNPIFAFYLKERDALIYEFIEIFLDHISKNVGNLRSIDVLHVLSIFLDARESCRAICFQVYEDNRDIDVVCEDFVKFIYDQLKLNK